MRKKSLSFAIAAIMMVTIALAGCGKEESTSGTASKTATSTTASTADATSTAGESTTEESKTGDASETAAESTAESTASETSTTDNDTTDNGSTADPTGTDIPEESIYGGIWGQSAIVDVLDYAAGFTGKTYICTNLEKAYLRNQEKWLVEIKEMDGDGTLYHFYIDENEIVPQEVFPPEN
jgi:hypothetical protein